jgi:hypothetical protein
MSPQVFRLWAAIKVPPAKWAEQTYGEVGGGFWVVAIIGNRVIWFNDIEDGFNCSSYVVVGKLAEYICNQDELEIAVQDVLTMFVIEQPAHASHMRFSRSFNTWCIEMARQGPQLPTPRLSSRFVPA